VDVSENGSNNGNGSNQGSEDWFEQRVGPDEPPVRFVERRQGGRRRSDSRVMGELPSSNLPAPTVSLVIPTRNEARNVADVLDRLPKMITEVILVDASSDVTKLMAARVARTFVSSASLPRERGMPSEPAWRPPRETSSSRWTLTAVCLLRKFPGSFTLWRTDLTSPRGLASWLGRVT